MKLKMFTSKDAIIPVTRELQNRDVIFIFIYLKDVNF